MLNSELKYSICILKTRPMIHKLHYPVIASKSWKKLYICPWINNYNLSITKHIILLINIRLCIIKSKFMYEQLNKIYMTSTQKNLDLLKLRFNFWHTRTVNFTY